jgi:hypothetical protein
MQKTLVLSLWKQLSIVVPALFGILITIAACSARAKIVEWPVEGVHTPAVPIAEYKDVAWLDQETLAFKHRRPLSDEEKQRIDNYQISLYQSQTGAWLEVPLPVTPEECADGPGFIRDLRSVPNRAFGYTYWCLNYGISGTLYLWDRDQNLISAYLEYPPPSSPAAFSFSPDMSVLVQEEAEGGGLNNNLFRVDADGNMEQLFPDFVRVAEPSWSPDGQAIAFIGTERYSQQIGDLGTWIQIESALLYPWDLYLMDADGSNVRILFPKIGRPYQLKWSPDGKQLFFAGRRPGVEGGIWRLDIATLEVVRLWPYNTYYDLSPDGEQLVIIVEEKNGETVQTYPAIFAIP